MKFLIYTETFPDPANKVRFTGIGRYCYDLGSGLVELGHEVAVLTGESPIRGPNVAPPEFRVTRIGSYSSSLPGLARRTLVVCQFIRDWKPDLVLFGDTLSQNVGLCLRGLCRVRYCPVFYGTDLQALRKMFRTRRLHPFQGFHGKLLKRYIRGAFERICISEYTCSLLSDVLGTEASAAVVYPCVGRLYLGIGGTLSKPITAVSCEGQVTFITVGRISLRKNQLHVLRILANLHDQEKLDFRYWIVGNVDSEEHRPYLHEIQRFISDRGLAGRVEIFTSASDEAVIARLDASDVFVMLSQAAGSSVEGFGISVIEAASRALPAIVSDHGGMRETVIAGVTGLVVPLGDDTAVADALTTLARDRDRRYQMGVAARERVLGKFTPRSMATRLIQALDQSKG